MQTRDLECHQTRRREHGPEKGVFFIFARACECEHLNSICRPGLALKGLTKFNFLLSFLQVQLSAADIKEYFERAADRIECVRMCSHSTQCYGIVYLRATKYNMDTFKGEICIHETTIAVSDQQPTIYHGILDSYEQSDSASIMWLDNYCLQKVFSNLDATDLSNIAEVCHRFKLNAQSQFATQHKDLEWFESPLERTPPPNTKLLHFSKILRNFGECIESLTIESPTIPAQLMELAIRHCSALHKLKMECVEIKDSDLVERLRPMFSHLRELNVEECSPWFIPILPYCEELEDLYLFSISYESNPPTDADTVYAPLLQHFPKLKSASLSYMERMTSAHFVNFLEKNPQLKRLEMPFSDEMVLETIVMRVESIEELHFNFEHIPAAAATPMQTADSLKQLRSLKKLEISDFGRAEARRISLIIGAVADSKSSIEQLSFCEVSFTDADIAAICKMTHLKCIHFVDYADVTFPQLIRICESLDNIEKLKVINSLELTVDEVEMIVRAAHKLTSLIIENVNINVDAFKRIANVVSQRDARRPLNIQIHNREMCLKLPKKLVNVHKHLLTVEEVLVVVVSFDQVRLH